MKIKEITLSKTIKQTRASKTSNGLTNYDSIEPSMAITIENPTKKDVEDGWKKLNNELQKEIDTTKEEPQQENIKEPDWMKKRLGK